MFLKGIILFLCIALSAAGKHVPLCCNDFPPETLAMHTTTEATEDIIQRNEQQLRHVGALIDELRTLRSRQKHAFETWQKKCTEQVQGDTGAVGETGLHGAKGSKGERGQWGEYGPEGGRGPPGSEGFAGQHGTRGSIGSTGDIGPDGIPGSAIGVPGQKGEQGVAGRDGNAGGNGTEGYQGPRGQIGDHGSPGTTGMASYCCNTGGPSCCNPGWTVNEDHTKCFFVNTTAPKLNFDDASNFCKNNFEGELASIKSEADNNLIYTLFNSTSSLGAGVWIGGYHQNVANNLTGWIWKDTTPWNYTKWDTAQPDGVCGTGNPPRCLSMFTIDHPIASEWDDTCCDSQYVYVCATPTLTANSDCTA